MKKLFMLVIALILLNLNFAVNCVSCSNSTNNSDKIFHLKDLDQSDKINVVVSDKSVKVFRERNTEVGNLDIRADVADMLLFGSGLTGALGVFYSTLLLCDIYINDTELIAKSKAYTKLYFAAAALFYALSRIVR